MELDFNICNECLQHSSIHENGKFTFNGMTMYFDGEKSHFFLKFTADILNYGRKTECEIDVANGEMIARRIFTKEDFRHSFKGVVPKDYNEEILRNGTISRKCMMYDAYFLDSINKKQAGI